MLSITNLLLLSVAVIPSAQSHRINYCPSDEIYRIGTKTICEYLFNRKPVLCLSPIQGNTKAFINCRYGYGNKQNLSEQIISCTYSGRWSEPPLECEDICEGTPTRLDVFRNERWFIEMKGKMTACNGIILNAKIILTKANCVLEYRPTDLQLETVEPDPQTLVVKAMHYDGRQKLNPKGQYSDDVFAIVELENNIIYDPHVISACIDFTIPAFAKQKPFIEENLEKFKASKTLDFPYIKSTCAPELFMNSIQDHNAIKIQCVLGSRKIPCDKPFEQGSIVRIRCKIGYQKTNPNSPDEIKCVSEGKWNYEVDHKCELICGQLDIEQPSIIPLVSNGKPIDIINVPWHVGIYSNSATDDGSYEQICGGTLVHVNVVFSAAHCFFNEGLNRFEPLENYWVASGKRFRNFNSPEKAQFARIKELKTPSTYNINYYRHDLAVLVLDHNLEFNAQTRPACLDWFPYGEYDIEGGKQGRVVGWGARSPTLGSSSELLAIELTTLSNADCKRRVHPNNREVITGEKFCAVGKRNESACKGDSGSGFLIKKRYNYDEDRYHLLGVVSSGINQVQHCSPFFLTTYTNIQYHQDILRAILLENGNKLFRTSV